MDAKQAKEKETTKKAKIVMLAKLGKTKKLLQQANIRLSRKQINLKEE